MFINIKSTPKNEATMKNKLQAIWLRLTSLEYSPRHTRLTGDLASYRPLIEKRIADTGSDKAQWAVQARILLDQAEIFLKKHKIDEGWKSYHTAKRLEVNGMSETERQAIAKELLVESSKLNDWRRDAIIRMLTNDDKKTLGAITPEVLIRAMEIKDEHYNNQYYKNTLSRSMFQLLFFLLLVFIACAMVYFTVLINRYGSNFAPQLPLSELLTGVLIFAFLGAITSAILFTRYSTEFSRLTEIGSNSVITLSKIFVGASFSVFIFLILKSSVAGSIQLFSFTLSHPLDYFAVAFVSGFSERLAQKAIDAIIGKDK